MHSQSHLKSLTGESGSYLVGISCTDIDLPQAIATHARVAFFCELLPLVGVQ